MTTEISAPQIQDAVRRMFDRVAAAPKDKYRFEVGPDLARAVGYPERLLASLPTMAAESFTGLAFLHPHLDVHPGEHLLDLGCGAGLDSLIAVHAVSPGGSVTGLDLSEAMLAKARALASSLGTEEISFRRGEAEAMPFADATFDAVFANGLFNLCPDKRAVAREICRVLKSGRRAIIAEITFTDSLPSKEIQSTDDWFR